MTEGAHRATGRVWRERDVAAGTDGASPASILEAQIQSEREGDLEAVVAALAEDVIFDAVGAWAGEARGRDAARRLYEAWMAAVLTEQLVRMSRLAGAGFAVDEAMWHGRVIGRIAGRSGGGRLVAHRVLRIVEIDESRITREVVWRDLAAIEAQLR